MSVTGLGDHRDRGLELVKDAAGNGLRETYRDGVADLTSNLDLLPTPGEVVGEPL